MISICLPLLTKSEANCRDHFRVVARRKAEQRTVVRMVCAARGAGDVPMPVVVRFIRPTARRPLDDDNLRSALKACRDGVADALGIDDGSPLVRWEYSQSKGKNGTLQIEIRMEQPKKTEQA